MMGELIAFCIGFMLGGLFGVIVVAVVVGAKKSREEWEIEEAIERIEGKGGEE